MGSAGSQAGVHRLSMTHVWEAAKFDDACTVPTTCLLLSGENHIRLGAQCTHIVLPSVTKVCNVIIAALGPLMAILLKNIVPVGYKQGISVDPLMRPIPHVTWRELLVTSPFYIPLRLL